MKKTEWMKTPYAGTQAQNTEKDFSRLFEKYGIEQYQYSRGVVNGRPAFQVRFVLNDKPYRFKLETLEVEGVADEKLISQLKRVLYFQLKSLFETATVFMTPEELMFSFLELPKGTVYELAEKHMDKLGAIANEDGVVGFLTS